MTVVVATSTGVAVALVYPQPQEAKVVDHVDCYSDTDLRADPFHGGGGGFAGRDTVESPQDAVAVCLEMWRLGYLVPGSPSVVSDRKETTVVPRLVACVRNDAAAIFPSDDPDFCRKAGLPPLSNQRTAG